MNPNEVRSIQENVRRALKQHRVDEWSRNFLADMDSKLSRYGVKTRFSDKQARTLSRLIGRPIPIAQGPSPHRSFTQNGRPARALRSLHARSLFGSFRPLIVILGFALGAGAVAMVQPIVAGGDVPAASLFASAGETVEGVSFRLCGQPPHYNCVIDGDTFYLRSRSIRIADIDTPETNPPRCQYEADLGKKATRKLHELLNAGPFVVVQSESRNEDQYGRLLRTVTRDGRSVGQMLVSEGLARTWTGRRQPWCT